MFSNIPVWIRQESIKCVPSIISIYSLSINIPKLPLEIASTLEIVEEVATIKTRVVERSEVMVFIKWCNNKTLCCRSSVLNAIKMMEIVRITMY